jgi:hypothetical protein
MNFNEILKLHKAVSAFKFETSDDQPKLCVYETQNRKEGYVLFIKPKSPNDAYAVFLENIAEEHMLSIQETRGYIVMHSFLGSQ